MNENNLNEIEMTTAPKLLSNIRTNIILKVHQINKVAHHLEFYKISPLVAGNAFLESLDYKIFCGCMPLEMRLRHVMPKPHFIRQDENISFLQACDYETMLS